MTSPSHGEPTVGAPAHAGGPAAMPSLDLLRSLTDEHVLRAVMEHGRLTRADIAAKTGISKPTISESVRRMAVADVLVDTGERTSGRGRAGSYYTLSDTTGTALVVSIRPDGVLTFWEDSVCVAARVAAALGLPTNPPDAVDAMVAFVRAGPGHASVDRVEVDDGVPTGLSSFDVR